MNDVSPRIVEQRMRNRVIETLELAGSFQQQQEYARAVPIAYVPHEVIAGWADFVLSDPNTDPNISPVYSQPEVDAMKRFHVVWQKASDALPDNYPALGSVHSLPEWLALRDEAQAATAIFNARGPMPEDREVE
jgi:hypothetical protein